MAQANRRARKRRRVPKPDALTISVPEAGKKYLGIERNAAYRAAKRGEIPTIRVGRLQRVPVVRMERMLEGVE